ncbi:MAG: hypothetical protein U1F61_06955 [Opitutaceae bacterium]
MSAESAPGADPFGREEHVGATHLHSLTVAIELRQFGRAFLFTIGNQLFGVLETDKSLRIFLK